MLAKESLSHVDPVAERDPLMEEMTPLAVAGVPTAMGWDVPEPQTLMSELRAFEETLAQEGLTPEQIHEQVEQQFGGRFQKMAQEQGFSSGEEAEAHLRELYEASYPRSE